MRKIEIMANADGIQVYFVDDQNKDLVAHEETTCELSLIGLIHILTKPISPFQNDDDEMIDMIEWLQDLDNQPVAT